MCYNLHGCIMKQKSYEYKLDIKIGNKLNIAVMIVLLIILLFTMEININFHFYYISIMVLWLILHEVIHYFAYLINSDVDRNKLYLGMAMESGLLYCQCSQLISRKSILISLLAPFTLIGIITLIVSYFINSDLLALLSIINISGSIFDILMAVQMLKMPKDIKFGELGNYDSYYIVTEHDIKDIRVLGLILTEIKDYKKEELKTTQTKRINISKSSWMFLIFTVLITVFDFILEGI